MHDYPVQEAKLRAMLTALTELRLAEPRTSDPAEFSRLGLDDPNDAASTGDLLRLIDRSDKTVLALIVGHRRVRSQANVPDQVYVRRPEQIQSWLAEGSLQVDSDVSLWLDRNVMNIAHDRIRSVSVDRPGAASDAPSGNAATGGGATGSGATGGGATGDGATGGGATGSGATGTRVGSAGAAGEPALVFGRRDGKFMLTQPADHPKLEDYKVEDVARALELLTFQEVKAAADLPGTEAGHSVFTTDDGLAVAVTVLHADKDVWARFAVSGSPTK